MSKREITNTLGKIPGNLGGKASPPFRIYKFKIAFRQTTTALSNNEEIVRTFGPLSYAVTLNTGRVLRSVSFGPRARRGLEIRAQRNPIQFE